LPGLVGALRRLLASPDDWRRMSASCRRNYCERKTVDATMTQFEKLFSRLTGPQPVTPPPPFGGETPHEGSRSAPPRGPTPALGKRGHLALGLGEVQPP